MRASTIPLSNFPLVVGVTTLLSLLLSVFEITGKNYQRDTTQVASGAMREEH